MFSWQWYLAPAFSVTAIQNREARSTLFNSKTGVLLSIGVHIDSAPHRSPIHSIDAGQHRSVILSSPQNTPPPRSTVTNTSHTYSVPTAFFKGWVPGTIVIIYKRLLPKTNVVTLAELLAGFGSKLGELTIAVFVTDAGTGGIEIRTVKLTVAEAPLASFPKLH